MDKIRIKLDDGAVVIVNASDKMGSIEARHLQPNNEIVSVEKIKEGKATHKIIKGIFKQL